MRKILKVTEELRADNEAQAREIIETAKQNQTEENYFLLKASYEYKKKTSKGEIIDEGYLVKLVKEYGQFFELED